MKFKTLLSTGIIVFFFSLSQAVFALTPDEIACNQSVDKGDATKAISQSAQILKSNAPGTSALICQGRAYYLMNKIALALSAFKKAELSTNDRYDQAVARILAGHTYKKAQQFTEAIKEYQQAIQYAEQSKNNALIMNSQLNIGDIHMINQQTNDALAAYLEASKLAGNDNERGATLEKVAATYAALKQYDLAVEYQVKAYLMMEKSGTLDEFANASVTLGRYYFLNKNYASAEHTLNKIIKFAKDQGGAYYDAKGSYILAQVKAAQNDKTAAKTLLEYAKSIAKNTQDKALENEINRETNALL